MGVLCTAFCPSYRPDAARPEDKCLLIDSGDCTMRTAFKTTGRGLAMRYGNSHTKADHKNSRPYSAYRPYDRRYRCLENKGYSNVL